MRALLLVHVEALAVVTPHAFARDDLRPPNRAPLARLLADLAALALGPALDAEDRQVREDAQRRADGAEKAAVQVAHEHGGHEQDAEADPHGGRSEQTEHPERLRVPDRSGDVLREQVVAEHARQHAVLDPVRVLLDPDRNLEPHLSRNDGIHQLRERAERADAPAVDAPPENRRDDHEQGEGVPRERVLERRHAQVGEPEHVADRHEAALHEPHVADRRRERDVFQPDAPAEEADERERDERGQQREVERLRSEDLAPGLRRVHYFTASGVKSFAAMRELSRIARVALAMLIDARETASTSSPTLNGSRTFLPLNCSANLGGSTEK